MSRFASGKEYRIDPGNLDRTVVRERPTTELGAIELEKRRVLTSIWKLSSPS